MPYANPIEYKAYQRLWKKNNIEYIKKYHSLYRMKHKKDKIFNLYHRWAKMKSRCLNKNHRQYSQYGGRGIIICEKWITFDGFKKDMESTFKLNLTLDRINNNKSYYKKNCRWTTAKEQANNRRNNRFIKYKNSTKTLSQWIKYFGLKRGKISYRLNKLKWPIEKCFEYREV